MASQSESMMDYLSRKSPYRDMVYDRKRDRWVKGTPEQLKRKRENMRNIGSTQAKNTFTIYNPNDHKPSTQAKKNNSTQRFPNKQGRYELPEVVITAKKPVMTSLDAPRNKEKLQSQLVGRFKKGTERYNVANLQKQLLNLGFYGEGATSKQQIDGSWGKNTNAAWEAAKKAGYTWKNGKLMSKKETQAYERVQREKFKAKMLKEMQEDNKKAIAEAINNPELVLDYTPQSLARQPLVAVPNLGNTYLDI